MTAFADIETRALRSSQQPRAPQVRGIRAKLRRSQPGFAILSFTAVRPATQPCSKLHGIWRRRMKRPTNTMEVAMLFAGAVKIIFGLAICSLPFKMGLTFLSGILCMFGLIVILVGLGGIVDGIHELKAINSSFLHRTKQKGQPERQPEPGA